MQMYKDKIGIIYNIQRYSLHDGPGIRTIVFLKGCPLRCRWCSNPESQRIESEIMNDEIVGYESRVSEIIEVLVRDKIFYKASNGGVTLSGGEPLFQWTFASVLAEAIKLEQIHLAIETTGYQEWKKLWSVLKWADLILYDLKVLNRKKHVDETGVDNVLILENLSRVVESGKKVILRIPVIPAINDSTEELEKLCLHAEKIGIKEVELLPYHRLGEGKYKALNKPYQLSGIPSMKKEILEKKIEPFIERMKIDIRII
jgi:pyruvate formate lyase activating enzyme